MSLLEVTMKYGRLVVFIGHDSAEKLGFRYGLTLVIGILKIMASTGVFVRVVCALKHSIEKFPSQRSIILT
jgi:mevalonate kinase